MPRTSVLTWPIAAAASMSWPMTSPMTSTVSPSGCRKASYQSPPIETPCVAGRYRTASSRWSGCTGRREQAQLQPLGHLLVGRGEPGVVQRQRRAAGGDLRRPQLGLGVRPALGPVDQGERAEHLAAGDQREGGDGGGPQRLQRRARLGARRPSPSTCSAVKSGMTTGRWSRSSCGTGAVARLVATRRSA